MRKPVRILSLMLVVSILGCCACSKKKSSKVTHENLIRAVKNQGAEERDSIDVIMSMQREGSIYAICEEDAQEQYDQFVNVFTGFPRVKVEKVTVFIDSDWTDESNFFAIALTAKKEKQAKEFFENRDEAISESADKYDSGETDGYTYAIAYQDGDRAEMSGLYLKDDTIIFVRCLSESDDGIDKATEFYKDLGLISPCDL